MFGFVGRCMQTSMTHILLCTNASQFKFTSIRDTQFNIKSGEYIHATIEPIKPGSRTYEIEVLFARSFKPDMTGRRRLSEFHLNTLTLLVQFTNSNLTHNETQIYDDMWSRSYRSVSTIFNESSYGAVQFDKDIAETRTVSISPDASQICEVFELMELAFYASGQPFTSQNSTFSRIEFIMPREFGATCNNDTIIQDGFGTVGCNERDCYSVIHDNTVFTRAHELGHSFGMGHSHACEPAGSQCAKPFAYGDRTSLMGGGRSLNTRKTTGGFTAPDRIIAGWLGDLHITNITDAAANGRFELSALAAWPSEKPHVIRFPSRCPAVEIFTGDKCETVFSYRAPVGVDTDIRGGGYSSTVSVHIWQPKGGTNTLLVANLKQGESYQMTTGQVISVSETYPTHVVTTVCQPNSAYTDYCGAPQTPDLLWVILAVGIAAICAMVGYAVYVNRNRFKSIY